MLIDTHAHVNFRAYKEDAKEVLERSLSEGVWVVNIGSQIDTSRQAVELANQFPPSLTLPIRLGSPSARRVEGREKDDSSPLAAEVERRGVYAVVGLHPIHIYSQHVDEEETHFLTREEHFDTATYRSMAENPKVVGIGECGLDYYHLSLDKLGTSAEGLSRNQIDQIKENQKQAFIAQIKLAKELNKALVVHSRSSKGTNDAAEEILEVMNYELGIMNQGENNPSLSPSPHEGRDGERLRFVLHSYTGSPEIMQEFLMLGAYVSFNGIITFDKTGNMEKLVKLTPLDKILLETDCPYLTPMPHRGKRNEPAFVKFVAEKLAEIKGLLIEEIEEITTENAKKLFKL